jgi:hypothetical protein
MVQVQVKVGGSAINFYFTLSLYDECKSFLIVKIAPKTCTLHLTARYGLPDGFLPAETAVFP